MTVQELLFYAYFAIMLAIKGFGLTAGPVYQAGFLLASLLAVLKILMSTYTKKEAGLVFGLLALTGVSFLQTGDYSVIIYSLLILSLKGIRQERVMKLAATVWTPVFLFQILTQLLNLRTRDFVVHSKYSAWGEIKSRKIFASDACKCFWRGLFFPVFAQSYRNDRVSGLCTGAFVF